MYEDTVVSFSHPDKISTEDPLTEVLRTGARRLLPDAVEGILGTVYLFPGVVQCGGNLIASQSSRCRCVSDTFSYTYTALEEKTCLESIC